MEEERGSYTVNIPRRLVPYLEEAHATGLYGLTVDQVAAQLLGTQIAHLMAVKILHPHPPALEER